MDYQKMSGKFDSKSKVWEGAKIPYPVPMDMHIGELVINYLKNNPKCVVQLSHDDGSEMTAEELRMKIIRVAQNLQKLGIKSEDVVSVMCENSMDLIAFINGIVQIGAIANVFSVGLSEEDLVNLFKDLKPKLMLADANIYEKVKNVLNELNNKALILVNNGEIVGNPSTDELLKPTGQEESYKNMKFENAQSKIVAILASSGSTGPPKGVCMSQAFFVKFLTISPWDENGTRSLTFSGVFWGSAFRSLFLSALTNHSRVVTKKPYTPETFIEMATKHKATYLNLNPPGWTLLLQSPAIHTLDTKHVTMVCSVGGIFTVELRKKMKKIFPSAFFMNLYGMTEITGAYNFPGQPIDDLTVGYVPPNHSMKIVDENGNSLGLEETGEILIKFDLVPFLGYYNNVEATEESMDAEGYFKSGDIGYIKENGFVYVVDRKKDIFKFNAFHINPSDIENVIQSIEGVEYVSVFGIPNAETYNFAAAMIEKKKGFEKLKEQDVIKYVADRMPEHQQLHGGVYFVDKMPMTKNDKISKRDARDKVMKVVAENQKKTE